jgi:hypothetical protein
VYGVARGFPKAKQAKNNTPEKIPVAFFAALVSNCDRAIRADPDHRHAGQPELYAINSEALATVQTLLTFRRSTHAHALNANRVSKLSASSGSLPNL